ncbi:MAG: YbhN family protein [Candidatus Scalindua sp.]
MLFKIVPKEALSGVLGAVPIWGWLIAGSISLGYPFLVAKRWSIVLSCMRLQLPMTRCVLLVLASFAINPFTISKAGDFLKAFFLRKKISIWECSGSILVEKFLDIITVLILGLFGAIIIWIPSLVLLSSLSLVFLIGAFCIAPKTVKYIEKWPTISEKMLGLILARKSIAVHPLMFTKAMMISLIVRCLSFLQIFIIVDFLDMDISLTKIFAVFPIAICVGLLPITLSGIGTRDAVLVMLLTHQTADALALGIAYTLFNYFILSFLGIPFLIWILSRKNVFRN